MAVDVTSSEISLLSSVVLEPDVAFLFVVLGELVAAGMLKTEPEKTIK